MKRIISILMAIVMLIGVVPAAAFAQDEPIRLEGVEIVLQDDFDSTGIDFVAFGANGVSDDNIPIAEYTVPEKGTYSVTVHRAGDLTLESMIMVGTLDVSAVYGKDYRVLKGDYVIEELEHGKSLIEQYMDPANRVSEDELTTTGSAIDVPGDAELAEEPQTEASATETPEAPAANAGSEKSALALLKEEQTGKSTRETADAAVSPTNTILDSIGLNPIDVMDPSVLIGIVFAPGETEKEIVFEILDDKESEGKEVFDLDISTLDDITNAVSPYTCSIVIEDDEPVEHSAVNFVAAEYVSENDEAVITVERTGADYTYATIMLRTLEDGSAREGLDYAAIDMELEFLPNQMETSVVIPTVSGQNERDFIVELYDARGCVLGTKTKATVVIPEQRLALLAEDLELAESGGYKAGSTFTADGTNYKLAAMDGSSAFKIMASSNVGDRYVGIFYPPNNDWFSYGRWGDDPNSSSEWKYSSGSIEGKPGPVGYLYWYSNWCWDYGGCYGKTTITKPWIFQTAYMDLQVDSGLNSVSMGYYGQFLLKNGSAKYTNDFRRDDTTDRQIYGPATTFTKVREGEYKYSGSYDGEKLMLQVNAERTGFSAARPEVWFWGAPCFFREFYITQSDPAEMEYKTIDSNGNMTTTKRIPAQVRMLTTNGRYLYERVTFACSPYQSSVIGGTLIGFNIKPSGTDKVIFRANENSGGDDGFTIDEALLKEIDKAGGIASKNSGNHYVNYLDVTPVFQYKDVKVEVINDTTYEGQSVGYFKYENQLKNNTWHVGDELPMAAVVRSDYDLRYSYQTYIAYGCVNPGDPQSAYAVKLNPDRYLDHKSFTLSMKKYYVTPEFTDEGNYIAVKLDSDAAKYFAFKDGDILTDVEVSSSGNANMKKLAQQGYKFLRTSAADKYTPTPSMAYSLQLLETSANGGNYRPVFSNNWANARVQGFSFDLLAAALPSRNIITVSAEKVDKNAYRNMVLEGKVQYSSVSMRDSSSDLRNVPAEGVAVYGGANPIAGAMAMTEMLRISTESDHNGTFGINGVRAIPGDTISLLCHHEGVWQVRYFKLPKTAPVEKREIYVGSYDPATGKVKYEIRNEDAMVINLMTAERSSGDAGKDPSSGVINLPIRTNYTPYIRNFYFAHTNYPKGSTLGNTCEIVDQDSVIFDIEVENNGVSVSAIKMRFVRNGVEQFVEKAVPTGPNSKTYRGSVSSERLMPGFRLEFQIESPEKNKAHFDTQGAVKDQEVEKVFPSIDSGLTFYVPDEAGPSQEITVEFPDELGKMPMMGKLSQSVQSGKLIYNVEYEKPADPKSGYRYNTVGLSIDVNVDKKSREQLAKGLKEKLNGIRSTGGAKAQEDAKQSYPDRAAAVRQGEQDAAFAQIDADNVTYPDAAAKQDAKDNWNADHPAAGYNLTEYKNGLVEMSDNKVTVGLTFLLRFEYLFDENENSWSWTGTQIYINAYIAAGKTFPTVLFGCPVYLYVGGKVSLTLEFAFSYDSAEGEDGLVMRRRMKEVEKKSGNITAVMSSGSPWITLAGTLTIYGGIGVNGILSIRGVGNLNLAVKYNFDTRWDPRFGFTWGAAGGIGFDLLLVSANIMLVGYEGLYGAIYKVTPKFHKDGELTESGNGTLQENVISQVDQGGDPSADIVFRSYDMGNESLNAFGDQLELSSTLVPAGERDVIQGTLEYIRPTVVELDSDHFMLVFLKNMSGDGRDTANASSVCYSIGTRTKDAEGKETMSWHNIYEIERDADFDTMPAALKVGDDVFVAWSSANASGNTDVESVKQDLQDMDIHIAKIKKNSGYRIDGSFGQNGILKINNDDFLNYGARLVNENGNIALYYIKKDLSKAGTEAEILDFETNFSTWARTIVTPQGEILKQKTATGMDVQEFLIPIEHPTVTDPFVSEFMAGTYVLANSHEYRIMVYTVAADSKSANTELWAKIDNLTDGRSFYPIKISEGSESLSQPQLTQIRRKGILDKEGHTGIVDDLMLTWITDGTKLHTISAHDVFDSLRYEDGNIYDDGGGITGTVTSFHVIKNLTASEISLPNWTARAKDKMLESIHNDLFREQFSLRYPMLNALSDTTLWLEDLGTIKDFGNSFTRTSVDEAGNESESSYSTGLTLESYRIVSGEDNNIYMFWTWPLSLTGSSPERVMTGNEIWGSSYETDTKYTAAAQTVSARPISRGWSDPVQVTDYTMRSDAASYPNGRFVDEICPVVGTDSGALVLGNAYSITYDDSGIVYGRHNLTEIVCESEGSLKVEDVHFEDPDDGATDYYPLPASVSNKADSIAVTIKNDGLLPARDYVITVNYSADGKAAKPVFTYSAVSSDGDADTIYAGESYTLYFDGFDVPDFTKDLKLIVTAQEFKPGTTEAYTQDGEVVKDTAEYSVKRESVLDFMPVSFDGYVDPSYVNYEDINQLINQFGSDKQEFEARLLALLEGIGASQNVADILDSIDARAYFLYNEIGDLGALSSDFLGSLLIDGEIPFVVFVPVENAGNKSSGKLSIEVVRETYTTTDDGGRDTTSVTVGTAEYGEIAAREQVYIPVIVKLTPDMINDLGGCLLKVHVTSGGKRVDNDNISFGYKVNRNVKVSIDVADASRTLTTDENGYKVLSLKQGDTVPIKAEAYPYRNRTSVDIFYSNADPINDTEPVIGVDANNELRAIKPGTAYLIGYNVDSESVMYDLIKVVVDDGSGGGGSSGGGSSSGGGGGSSVTPAKPSADGTTTTTTNNADGGKTETTKRADGTSVAVTTDKNGQVTAVAATVSKTAAEEAAKTGEAVVLPMSASKETQIKVDVPDGATVDVAIPTSGAKTSTVVYIVKADGTEEIVKDCDVQNGVVSVKLDSDCTLVLRDNKQSFGDVESARWSADAIDFVTSRQIMNGNGDGTFTPYEHVSRGMMAQVLYNLDRKSAPGNADKFTDSDALLWFEDAVGWASEEGIVTGNPNGSFGVNDDINREQAVTMLFRYANKIGLDTTKRASLDSFPDAGSVRSYSKDAMEWAVAVGLINGDEGKIKPEGSADREQLATMIMRFVKLMHK